MFLQVVLHRISLVDRLAPGVICVFPLPVGPLRLSGKPENLTDSSVFCVYKTFAFFSPEESTSTLAASFCAKELSGFFITARKHLAFVDKHHSSPDGKRRAASANGFAPFV